MMVLGISSATTDSGIALVSDGEVLGCISLTNNRGLSETLLPAIQELMNNAGSSLSALGAVSVTIGPGSFTGIRVGLAVAKSLSYALSLPLAGLSTMESLAYAGGPVRGAVYPLMDAGKGQVYAGCYRWVEGRNCQLVPVIPDSLTTLEQLSSEISPPAFLLGDAAAALRQSLADSSDIRVLDSPAGMSTPLSTTIARLGELKVAAGLAATVGQAANVSPVYLRRSEAEIVLDRKLSSHV